MKKLTVLVLFAILLTATAAFAARGGGGFGGGGRASFSGGGFKSSPSISSKPSSIGSSVSKPGSMSLGTSKPTVSAPLTKSAYMPSRSVMPASRAGRALPSYVASSRSYRGAPVYYSHSDSGSSMMPFFLGMYLGNMNSHNHAGAAGQTNPQFSGRGGDFGAGGAAVNIDDFGSMVLSRRINDFANVLTPEQEKALNDKFAALENISSNQVVLLTIPSLQGKDIQEVALESANLWKIGTAENNNGILIILAVAEKKVRIEVGRGLEGAYPDLAAKHILETAGPKFAAKDFAGGFNIIADDIFAKTKDEYNAKQTAIAAAEKKEKENADALATAMAWTLGIIALVCVGLWGFNKYNEYSRWR